jgi:ribosomal protein S18 acetylase RimI-like enzyme
MAAEQPAGERADEPHIRPLELIDLPEAARVSAAGFGFELGEPAIARRWQQRLAHLVGTDPEGGFVAERDGRIIGVAQAMKRERLWCLSLIAVDPDVQSRGVGRALLDRSLRYGADADGGLIVSSNDPRALRLYGLAGFSLHPTFQAEGPLDRRKLPPPHPGVREERAADLEALAGISREVRGAPHTPELEFALGRDSRLLRLGDRGFSVVQPEHGVWLLAARDEQAATALLWSALEGLESPERPVVRWITGEQRWAIDVVLRAGLRVSAYGALAVRGEAGRLWPFIPSVAFA